MVLHLFSSLDFGTESFRLLFYGLWFMVQYQFGKCCKWLDPFDEQILAGGIALFDPHACRKDAR